jgi:hypothetical protein
MVGVGGGYKDCKTTGSTYMRVLSSEDDFSYSKILFLEIVIMYCGNNTSGPVVVGVNSYCLEAEEARPHCRCNILYFQSLFLLSTKQF